MVIKIRNALDGGHVVSPSRVEFTFRTVREEMDFYRFNRLLKTHTFSLAYNVH